MFLSGWRVCLGHHKCADFLELIYSLNRGQCKTHPGESRAGHQQQAGAVLYRPCPAPAMRVPTSGIFSSWCLGLGSSAYNWLQVEEKPPSVCQRQEKREE